MRILIILCLFFCLVVGEKACVGFDHSCRIREDRRLVCVGKNEYGQLGINDYRRVTHSPGEIVVQLPADAVDIRCSVYFTCVLIESNELYCYGINYYGQLGVGSDIFKIPFPFTKVIIPPVYSFCCGDAHCLALTQSYTNKEEVNIYGWGLNNLGQLCIGNTNTIGVSMADFPLSSVNFPPDVYLTKNTPIRCAANGGAALITRTNFTTHKPYYVAYAWGDNRAGQLAYGDTNPPYDVIGDEEGEFAVLMNIGDDIVDIGFGYNHSCARLKDKTLRCSGDNQFGQIGYPLVDSVGTTPSSLPPLPVNTGMEVEDVGFYRYHTCFSEKGNNNSSMKNSGCFGLNNAYQLGLDSLQDNIGYDEGSMPPQTFLVPQNFSYISGAVPYLNSMGFIYVPIEKNETTNYVHLYIGWGLDNYTLQNNMEYVITPQILATECGDKFVDKHADEDCDSNKYFLDGNICTNRCYGLQECKVGIFTPFSDHIAPYEDILGCRSNDDGTNSCKLISPVVDGYCFDKNSWMISSIIPISNTTSVWENYSPIMDDTIFVLGDIRININQTLNLFKNSKILENINTMILLNGVVEIYGTINISIRTGYIAIIGAQDSIFDPKKIITPKGCSADFIQAVDKPEIYIRIYSRGSDRAELIGILVTVGTILAIIVVIAIVSVYISIRKRREYEPIIDSESSKLNPKNEIKDTNKEVESY